MQFTIKVDFFTNIITNSSSVVYSQANGVTTMFDFLNDVLTEFGVSQKAEEVFNISIIPDMDRLMDSIWDTCEDEGFQESLEGLNYENRNEKLKQKANEIIKQGRVDGFSSTDEYSDSSYLIETKDGKDTQLGRKVEVLFSHEATYDG